MISTAPGSELTVVTYIVDKDIHGFDTVVREYRGVLVDAEGDDFRIMHIYKDGDFSGLIKRIPQKSVIYIDAAFINDNHELEMI